MNVWSEIDTFIGFVNWYRYLLNMVATNYFEMASCFEILILSWIWALCLLQLVFFGAICCHYYFYEHGNDWEDLLNYFEIVLPYTTIEKWSFLSVNFFITVWRIDVQIKTCFLPWRVLISMSTGWVLSLGEMVISK